MNYDHVGYLIKNYLWGVNELPSTILRHKFSLIKKNKASQKNQKPNKNKKDPENQF